MTAVVTAHTSELDASSLAAAAALVEEVFTPDFDPHDWEHSLGGVHALVWDGDDLIGHAAVVQRRMLHGGRALRTGYVEGVVVRADRQRRGVGGALMAEVERVTRAAYDLGALAASKAGIALYAGRGWQQWKGPTSALTPDGARRTAKTDGTIYVLPGAVELDLSGELTCDWRDGDVW
jgi:aminoglycoside 2'-N-acetyltransferase I